MPALNPQPPTPVCLALGSNLGDRMAALRAAIKALGDYVDVTSVSPVYETKPAYLADQPLFLNAALTGTTKLAPLALLWNVKRLETELGRTPTFRFGPRLIDIDIIFYGDQIVTMPELIIPHPNTEKRGFVLRPLADIVPDWKDPQTGLTVAKMLAQLPETEEVPHSLGPLI